MYINTLRGPIQDYQYILLEPLFFDRSQKATGAVPVTIENLAYIYDNKYQLENLVVNDITVIAHELKDLPADTLILSGYPNVEKLIALQKCIKQTIAWGYSHNIQYSDEHLKLYTVGNLVQLLEISLTNDIKPAFIYVDTDLIDHNKIWLNIFESYKICSQKHKIPIIINQHNTPQVIDINDCYVINAFQEIHETQNVINGVYSYSYQCNPQPKHFYSKNLFKFGNMIDGVEFRMHLKSFGGKGFSSYRYDLPLCWAVEKPVVYNVQIWQCPICLKKFEQIEKIKKFDREFCSMACLRKYNKK